MNVWANVEVARLSLLPGQSIAISLICFFAVLLWFYMRWRGVLSVVMPRRLSPAGTIARRDRPEAPTRLASSPTPGTEQRPPRSDCSHQRRRSKAERPRRRIPQGERPHHVPERHGFASVVRWQLDKPLLLGRVSVRGTALNRFNE